MGFEHELDEMIESIVEDRVHGADGLSNAALEVMGETPRYMPHREPRKN